MEKKPLGELSSAALELGGVGESSLGYLRYSAAKSGDSPFDCVGICQ